jgi:hypothetical protein
LQYYAAEVNLRFGIIDIKIGCKMTQDLKRRNLEVEASEWRLIEMIWRRGKNKRSGQGGVQGDL